MAKPRLSRAHQMMVEDGAPLCILATPDNQRRSAEAWRKSPPRAVVFAEVKVTRNEDAETTAFRAAEDERRRQKSLAQIGKMKTRLAAKASPVDYSKMRWDPRRSKFVPDSGARPATQSAPAVKAPHRDSAVSPRVEITPAGAVTLTKDNAESIAKLNLAWKPEYEKLRGTGRIVMTIGNILRGKVKRGEVVEWI